MGFRGVGVKGSRVSEIVACMRGWYTAGSVTSVISLMGSSLN